MNQLSFQQLSDDLLTENLFELYINFLTIIDQETALYFYRHQLYYNMSKQLYLCYQNQQTDNNSEFNSAVQS